MVGGKVFFASSSTWLVAALKETPGWRLNDIVAEGSWLR